MNQTKVLDATLLSKGKIKHLYLARGQILQDESKEVGKDKLSFNKSSCLGER